MLLSHLTEFGNAAVLLLLGLIVTLWLAHTAGRRAALAWVAALCVCVVTIAAVKVYFLGCPVSQLGLHSPSGHAGFSAFIYGGVTLCVAQDTATWRRWLLPLVGCAWIALIAWSRYAVHAHTPVEILFGLAIGAAALLLFARAGGPLPRMHFPFVPVVLLVAACAITFYRLGWQLSFESWLRMLGHHYVHGSGFCIGAAGA